MAAVTVFPVYEDDQNSNPSMYLYCQDWERLVTKKELKGYTIHNRATHYYNLKYQMLVDFDYNMQVQEAAISALRTLADDELENFKNVLDGNTRSRKLK